MKYSLIGIMLFSFSALQAQVKRIDLRRRDDIFALFRGV